MGVKFDKILGKLRESDEDGSKGGGITDAPSDGKLYGRKDADWAEITETDLVIPVAYSALKTLYDDGEMTSGVKYLITDYQTVHTIPNTSDTNTGDTEPILVLATSSSTLSPIAYSTLYPQDIIYYDIVSNQDRVPGCTKGYIYRRIDTKKNNDFPLDFRAVKFRRWQIDVENWNSATEYSRMSVVKRASGTTQQQKEVYVSLVDGNTNHAVTDGSWWRRFKFDNESYISPTEGSWDRSDEFIFVIPCSENYQDYKLFSLDVYYETSYNNKIDGVSHNVLNNCNTVIFGADFYYNSIGANFNSNSIGVSFYNNSIGANFNSNSIGDGFYNNSIGDGFYNNSIGDGFNSNSIGDGFYNNSIGDGFNSNSIGVNFNSNSIGDGFYYNSIGVNFNYNSIGANFNSNSIGDGFYNNSIGDGFNSNSIGVNFNSNSIGANATNNVFENRITNIYVDNSPSSPPTGFFQNNLIRSGVDGNNQGGQFPEYANTSQIYKKTNTEIFIIDGGGIRLRYVDSQGNQVIGLIDA